MKTILNISSCTDKNISLADQDQVLKRVDFLGTFLIISAVVCIVLAVSWGGTTYPWNSPVIIGLFVAGAVLITCTVLCELFFAVDPILQFRLFSIRNVLVSTLGAFCIGYPMFGSITYLPLYFQVVKGTTATQSGLSMMPMMFGVVIGSMGSGFAVSKIGRYNFFPMIGLAIELIGLYLLSLLDLTSGEGPEIGYLFVSGLGVGLCLQTFLIAAQNSVEMKCIKFTILQLCQKNHYEQTGELHLADLPDIAVLTASINFYRTVGGVIGVAVFGAIFNSGIQSLGGSSSQALSVDSINALPPQIKQEVLQHFVNALSKVQVIWKVSYSSFPDISVCHACSWCGISDIIIPQAYSTTDDGCETTTPEGGIRYTFSAKGIFTIVSCGTRDDRCGKYDGIVNKPVVSRDRSCIILLSYLIWVKIRTLPRLPWLGMQQRHHLPRQQNKNQLKSLQN